MGESAIPQNERELGWEDEIGKDGTDFVLLPPGTYPFMVSKFERGRHTPSDGGKLPACNKAILTLIIDGGTLGLATVTNNLFLHTKTEGMVCQFFKAIGLKKHGENIVMNWQAVQGAMGYCKTKHHTYQGDVYNDLKSYISTDKAPGPIPNHAQFKRQPVQPPPVQQSFAAPPQQPPAAF